MPLMRKSNRWPIVTVFAAVLLGVLFPRVASAQAPPQLVITSPSAGTRLRPGDSLTVTVTAATPVTLNTLILAGQMLPGPIVLPASTTIVVGSAAQLGTLLLRASAQTSAGEYVRAAPVEVVLDRDDRPTAFRADSAVMTFENPGYDLPIKLLAAFGDGTSVSANDSIRVSFASSDEQVALVDKWGRVFAVGVGNATITATYDAQPPLRTSVSVTVEKPALAALPAVLTFGPQPIGLPASQTVTFTNSTRSSVVVMELAAVGDFTVLGDCVAVSPLAPGQSCTARVTYTPTSAGPVRAALRIATSYSEVPLGVPLFGEGLGLRASTTTLGSSANPSVLGQTLTFSATVADAGGGGSPAPAGSVTFAEGATVLSSVPLSSGGTASTAVTGLGVGSHAITAGYSGDTAFGPSTSTALTQVVRYAAAGTTCQGAAGHQILQPVNADGTSVFKQGRTVPAKFRVCNASGQSIGTAGVVQDFRLTQVISGTTSDVNENVPSTTPDAAFRWDASEQQWIFNISTAGQEAQKTYVYTVTLNDGTTIGFRYGLR